MAAVMAALVKWRIGFLLIIATDIGVLGKPAKQAGKWHAVAWRWQQSLRDKPVLRVVFKIKQGSAMAIAEPCLILKTTRKTGLSLKLCCHRHATACHLPACLAGFPKTPISVAMMRRNPMRHLTKAAITAAMLALFMLPAHAGDAVKGAPFTASPA